MMRRSFGCTAPARQAYSCTVSGQLPHLTWQGEILVRRMSSGESDPAGFSRYNAACRVGRVQVNTASMGPYWAERRVKPRSAKHSRSTSMVPRRRRAVRLPMAAGSRPLTANSMSGVPRFADLIQCGEGQHRRPRPPPFQTYSAMAQSARPAVPPRPTHRDAEGLVEQVVLFTPCGKILAAFMMWAARS